MKKTLIEKLRAGHYHGVITIKDAITIINEHCVDPDIRDKLQDILTIEVRKIGYPVMTFTATEEYIEAVIAAILGDATPVGSLTKKREHPKPL